MAPQTCSLLGTSRSKNPTTPCNDTVEGIWVHALSRSKRTSRPRFRNKRTSDANRTITLSLDSSLRDTVSPL
jgi:hypothetical protein